jgi:hypothetical protein
LALPFYDGDLSGLRLPFFFIEIPKGLFSDFEDLRDKFALTGSSFAPKDIPNALNIGF